MRTEFFEAVGNDGRKYWRYKRAAEESVSAGRDLIDIFLGTE